MASENVSNEPRFPVWLIKFCKNFSGIRRFTISSVVNIVISMIATWLLTPKGTDYSASPTVVILQHWPIAVGIFIVLMCLLATTAAIGQLPLPIQPAPITLPSASPMPIVETEEDPTLVIKERYLRRQILETQNLAIEGIPLLPPRVRLDEIFIPVQLFPHKSTIDQILTEEHKKLLRVNVENGRLSPENERVLIDYERQHEVLLRKGNRASIEDLWENLTSEYPEAVIQGYPGMGKSTLLLRLTLYMARRGLGENDPFGDEYTPLLVPIFIRLREYATYIKPASPNEQAKDTSITGYLESNAQELEPLRREGTLTWLKDCLEKGQCLVLFDGLDEVSDPADRVAVQDGIKAFINSVRSNTRDSSGYNRFLITSRVAGYDQSAFPAYLHYTIAELTPEQIGEFLPRWCRASVTGDQRGNLSSDNEEFITSEAAKIEQKLNVAMQSNQGIRELVENPFLLTLLAIMQQNGIELPRRRVELYTTLTKVLLETRNARRGLIVIPEAQAVQRLGPVAYQMQETKNSFMSREEVLASFAHTIQDLEKLSAEQAQTEAQAFLDRVRDRGGIFVYRTGHYLGFFHRTFQEYFAARDISRRLVTQESVHKLVEQARFLNDLWREPFLLTVAYKTETEANIANKIIHTLLKISNEASREQYAHDILLAGNCLLEAEESTISHELEDNIVQQLVVVYGQAIAAKDNDTISKVENILQSLLLSISTEAKNSVLLKTLQSLILDTTKIPEQKAVLTLLTKIAQNLLSCKDIVFESLVPPLLGLTELPDIGPFKAKKAASPPDLAVSDLALAALTFIGARGPAGYALKETKEQFEQYLPLLAEYSLSSGTLLTPVVVPLDNQNFQRYGEAIERWQKLYQQVQQKESTIVQAKTICISILQTTLDCGEEVTYPAYTHFLAMLQRSQNNPTQDWRTCWQDYLHEKMEQGTYTTYQTCARLWSTLFTTQPEQQTLAQLVQSDLHSNTTHERYTQRFLIILVRYLSELVYLSDLSNFSYLSELIYLGYFSYLRYFSYFSYLSDFSYLRHLSNLSDLRYSKYLSYSSNLIYLRYFRYLSEINFAKEIACEAQKRLSSCAGTEKVELLSLLFGHVLQISKGEEAGNEGVQEIQTIVKAVLPFAEDTSYEVRDLVFDTISALPARTAQEISYVINVAYNVPTAMQEACGRALQRSGPANGDTKAWQVIEDAQGSSIEAIREGAKKRRRGK